MKTVTAIVALLATVGLSGGHMRAQDPRLAEGRQAVRDILNRVQEDMEAIDHMLLEAGRPSAEEKGASRDRLLEQSDAAQTRVIRSIEELLKEIEKRQGQGC